ncbi:transglutaminase domain-containing protein [Marinobacterium lutimaris]|uniref:Transglutaminase-like enzyme, putative cysteine protease n=1 Tax=Marinobacterium lutimaris TaxID=568106 RepID=A0A1H5UWV7_9GAMM|nr:transglutaminase family protein [Marinobacterium lutimaris]SEF79632.1 Transglutaminase-like enzyme, putative cysteine protease [Marinobacterium lutimaris]
MWLQTSCELNFDIAVPTPFILMLRARSGAQQWVSREEYFIDPNVPVFEFSDAYGNLCQRLVAPPGGFRIATRSDVRTAETMDRGFGAAFMEIQTLPDSVLHYLLPSRFCESDRFCDMATEITAGCYLGYDQVAAIESWVRNNICYEPATSAVPASAAEINQRGAGVCRDLAHIGIALCRSLSIPARMVVGYLYELQPMDLHAWFEAYVGGRWYAFDPTQAELRGGYVTIGYGRDAADVAIYNQFGPPVQPRIQHVEVKRLG